MSVNGWSSEFLARSYRAMPVVCRFNRRKECLRGSSPGAQEALKTYTLDGTHVFLVYEKNARLDKPVAYEAIMQYLRFYLPRAHKNMVGQTVANDKTIPAPKPYKHIIDYTYEKKK